MDVVNTKAANDLKYREPLTVECSAMNGTSIPHILTSRFRKHWKKWWKDYLRHKLGGLGPKCLLDMVVPFCKNSQQLWLLAQDQASQHSCMKWGGKCTQAPTCSWGVSDIWWLLVLCLVFFRGVVPGSFPMPQWKATLVYMWAPLIPTEWVTKKNCHEFQRKVCVCVCNME